MTTNKLASFRIDNQLWQQFQDIARENNTTATALLTGYIKSVVNTDNTENIDTVNTTCEQSIQPSIQDIDNRIKTSIDDGAIGDAISKAYADIMGNFNELVDQVHSLKSELSAIRSQESGVTTTNNQEITQELSDNTILECQKINSTDIINDFSQWYTTQYKAGTQERKHKEIIKALKSVLKKYDIT